MSNFTVALTPSTPFHLEAPALRTPALVHLMNLITRTAPYCSTHSSCTRNWSVTFPHPYHFDSSTCHAFALRVLVCFRLSQQYWLASQQHLYTVDNPSHSSSLLFLLQQACQSSRAVYRCFHLSSFPPCFSFTGPGAQPQYQKIILILTTF